MPAANGVVTGRGLAKMYAVLANDGRIDGKKYLSKELVRGLTGQPRPKWPDANMVVPMPFHLGYHESPVPGLIRGFGHVGLGGTLGWADPEAGSSFGFVHNRLLTPWCSTWGHSRAWPVRCAMPSRRPVTRVRSRCRSWARRTPSPLADGRRSRRRRPRATVNVTSVRRSPHARIE